jgi:hypothetical protein
MAHFCYTRDRVPIPAQSLSHSILVNLDLASQVIQGLSLLHSRVRSQHPEDMATCGPTGKVTSKPMMILSPKNRFRTSRAPLSQAATFANHADRITVDDVSEHLWATMATPFGGATPKLTLWRA